jgi:hypothetical protein
MPSEQQQLLALLTETRDGQREIIELMSQRTIAWIAVPAILACIAAIAYLVIRYF